MHQRQEPTHAVGKTVEVLEYNHLSCGQGENLTEAIQGSTCEMQYMPLMNFTKKHVKNNHSS